MFRDLKTKAAREGITMKELLKSFVEKGLYEEPAAETAPIRSPLPAPRVSGGPPIKALTNAEIEEIFLQEDLERCGYLPKSPSAEQP